jgi:uncharacterized protein YbjT (DUF2867 family)
MPRLARILILGGGLRGRRLAAAMHREGHAVRIVSRSETARVEVEAVGAECFRGDPDRLGTLRGALEGVAVVCWLFATATGKPEQVQALHDSRLRAFLAGAVDSTMRGFLYEAAGAPELAATLAAGRSTVEEIARRNAIPTAFLSANPCDVEAWVGAARATLSVFL